MTTAAPRVRPPLAPTISAHRLAALRSGRTALIDGARTDADEGIAAAIERYVGAMVDADFGPRTIRALVEIALEVGLPMPRSVARRAQRARVVERWADRGTARAAELRAARGLLIDESI